MTSERLLLMGALATRHNGGYPVRSFHLAAHVLLQKLFVVELNMAVSEFHVLHDFAYELVTVEGANNIIVIGSIFGEMHGQLKRLLVGKLFTILLGGEAIKLDQHTLGNFDAGEMRIQKFPIFPAHDRHESENDGKAFLWNIVFKIGRAHV